MSLQKLLDPLMKPAARFYQARLGKELNKMGELTKARRPVSSRWTPGTGDTQRKCSFGI